VALAVGLAHGAAGCHREPGGDEEALRAEWSRLTAEKKRLESELSSKVQAILEEPEQRREDVEVVVAVPSSFLKEALSRALADGLYGLSLQIRNLEIHVVEDVKVRLLLPKVTLGTLDLDVLLQDVRGEVRAGKPILSIEAGKIWGAVPIAVTRGEGRARLGFHWKGRALTRPVCGDVSIIRDVGGALAPFADHLKGGATLAVEGAQFVLRPAIPPTSFRLVIEPSRESWAKVEEALKAQGAVCRFALEKADVVTRLRELLANGIRVTVHTEELKPLRIPVNLKERVLVQDRELEVTASPALLEIRRRYVWFGSDFEVARVSPSKK
jgi:hypothetical protein